MMRALRSPATGRVGSSGKGQLRRRPWPQIALASVMVTVLITPIAAGATGTVGQAPAEAPLPRHPPGTGAETIRSPGNPPPSVKRSAEPASAGGLPYNGGPVQHHIHVFLIFWGPAYKTNPSRVVSAQETLFSTLARSTYNGILDQYYDTSGQITNDVSLTDVWIDPVASTAAVGENSALAEVDRAIKLNSWPTKLNDQFLVIPQAGSTIALDDGFCAEHFYSGGLVYSIIPYVKGSNLPGYCFPWGSNSQVALAMTSLASHEYAESATDPAVTAWFSYDASTKTLTEIGDLCQPTSGPFGTVSAQYLWSNAASGCRGPGPGGPGPHWALQSSPNPTGSPESVLAAVSCTSATACTGVGHRESSSYLPSVLAERWNGNAWKIQSAPSPTGATLSELSGVSCPAVKVCAAVGDYEDRLGHPVTLAERWNGTAWAAQPTPDPGGDGNFARLTAVSCASANACTAVGDYSDRSGSTVPLAERWNGTSWTLQSTPLPGGAANAQLLSVSCPAMSACTAVGQYDDGAGLTKTLAERWGGSAWTVQSTPNPAGTEISRLSGVSCVSTTACTAVGAASETLFSGGSTLVESWNGTTWAIHSSPTRSERSFLRSLVSRALRRRPAPPSATTKTVRGLP